MSEIGNTFTRKQEDWVSVDDDEKPVAFDLVDIMGESGAVQKGWWTGSDWDYCPKLIKKPIVAWRTIQPAYKYKKTMQRSSE